MGDLDLCCFYNAQFWIKFQEWVKRYLEKMSVKINDSSIWELFEVGQDSFNLQVNLNFYMI